MDNCFGLIIILLAASSVPAHNTIGRPCSHLTDCHGPNEYCRFNNINSEEGSCRCLPFHTIGLPLPYHTTNGKLPTYHSQKYAPPCTSIKILGLEDLCSNAFFERITVPNAICDPNTMTVKCKPDFVRMGPSFCSRKPHLRSEGESCFRNDECEGALICKRTSLTCQCNLGYQKYIPELKACGKKQLGDSCSSDVDCQFIWVGYSFRNAVCRNSKCRYPTGKPTTTTTTTIATTTPATTPATTLPSQRTTFPSLRKPCGSSTKYCRSNERCFQSQVSCLPATCQCAKYYARNKAEICSPIIQLDLGDACEKGANNELLPAHTICRNGTVVCNDFYNQTVVGCRSKWHGVYASKCDVNEEICISSMDDERDRRLVCNMKTRTCECYKSYGYKWNYEEDRCQQREYGDSCYGNIDCTVFGDNQGSGGYTYGGGMCIKKANELKGTCGCVPKFVATNFTYVEAETQQVRSKIICVHHSSPLNQAPGQKCTLDPIYYGDNPFAWTKLCQPGSVCTRCGLSDDAWDGIKREGFCVSIN